MTIVKAEHVIGVSVRTLPSNKQTRTTLAQKTLQQHVGNAKGWHVKPQKMTPLKHGLANSIASHRATVLSMEFAMTAIVKMRILSSTSVQDGTARLTQSVGLVIVSTITALFQAQISAFVQKIKPKDVGAAQALNAPSEESASITGACLTLPTLWPQRLAQPVSVSMTATAKSLAHPPAQEFIAEETNNVSQKNASIIFARSPPPILTPAPKMWKPLAGSATGCSAMTMQIFSVKTGNVMEQNRKPTAMTAASGSFC